MSNTRKTLVFLVLTFAISWTALAAAWQQGLRDMIGTANPPPVFQLSIFGPAIAAVICTLVFERGQRLKALGLRLIPNWWWLGALILPALLGAIFVGVNLIANGQSLFEPAGWSHGIAAMAESEIGRKFPNLGTAIVVMIIVNTLTEELGWRGYLHHLWRPSGFLPAALVPGIVQGVWHWPLVALFGIGFTGNTLIDMALYPLFTAVLGIYHTLFRDRGASVLAAGIFHGAFNIVGSNSVGPGSYAVLVVVVLGAAAIAHHQRRVLKNPRSNSAASASPMPE